MKKKYTIQDIANEANVSKTTVSFYLNGKFDKMSEDTKKKIEEVIKIREYRPNTSAQSLKSKKSKLIGIIVADIAINFSNLLVKGADEVLDKLGYQIVVGSSNFNYNREKTYIDRMLDMGVDGIIVQPSNHLIYNSKELIKNQCPIIYVDSVIPEFQKGDVLIKTKDAEVINEAFEKLITFNYNKYIFVTEDLELLQVRKDRHDAFIEVTKKLKLNTSVVTVNNIVDLETDLSTEIDGKTLIFCSNGKVTQYAFNFLKSRDFDIPNDVGLIGFDTWSWTKYSVPKVTTINQPNYIEGQIAAENIIKLIKNKSVSTTELKAEINWEESTQ